MTTLVIPNNEKILIRQLDPITNELVEERLYNGADEMTYKGLLEVGYHYKFTRVEDSHNGQPTFEVIKSVDKIDVRELCH